MRHRVSKNLIGRICGKNFVIGMNVLLGLNPKLAWYDCTLPT